jgi:hypothetical protein
MPSRSVSSGEEHGHALAKSAGESTSLSTEEQPTPTPETPVGGLYPTRAVVSTTMSLAEKNPECGVLARKSESWVKGATIAPWKTVPEVPPTEIPPVPR